MITFADWYQQYPRKKARGDAEKAWAQALKKGHAPETIMTGLMRNLADMQRKEPQFVPYPATWLRGESFFDEPDAPRLVMPRQQGNMADFGRELMDRFNQRTDLDKLNARSNTISTCNH